jgi:oligopeptide transport system ATP-binding protein
MSQTTTVLEAKNVSKVFPILGGLLRRRVGQIQALRNVSWTLPSGGSLGVVGESGCGKSTLARLCVGLYTPTSGDILLKGASVRGSDKATQKANRRAIQMVFQDPHHSLNPRMTVEEMLSEPLQVHRLVHGRDATQKRVRELVCAVQLPIGYQKRLPAQLSGGERQRVGIARALAVEPDVLICDEPVASLDVSVGAKILELLRHLRKTIGMALLFISHDLGMVGSLCDDMAVMRQGQIVEHGPTEQLIKQPRHAYTRLLLRCARLEL